MKALRYLFVVALSLFLFFGTAKLRSVPPPTPADALSALQRAFENPPANSKIMMRWWWFGPSATKPELEREMKAMKEGGIGGFEVQPVYPLALDDPAHGFKNYPYLSDEFLDALKFTGEKAHELGLRMDLTIGSGWPFGGPHVPVTQAAGKLRIDVVPVSDKSGRVPMPNISAGEKLLAAFVAPGDAKNFDAAKAVAIPFTAGDALTMHRLLRGRRARSFIFHCEPNGNDGEAARNWRGRICAGSLRPRGDRKSFERCWRADAEQAGCKYSLRGFLR